jgi:hypothetical protein
MTSTVGFRLRSVAAVRSQLKGRKHAEGSRTLTSVPAFIFPRPRLSQRHRPRLRAAVIRAPPVRDPRGLRDRRRLRSPPTRRRRPGLPVRRALRPSSGAPVRSHLAAAFPSIRHPVVAAAAASLSAALPDRLLWPPSFFPASLALAPSCHAVRRPTNLGIGRLSQGPSGGFTGLRREDPARGLGRTGGAQTPEGRPRRPQRAKAPAGGLSGLRREGIGDRTAAGKARGIRRSLQAPGASGGRGRPGGIGRLQEAPRHITAAQPPVGAWSLAKPRGIGDRTAAGKPWRIRRSPQAPGTSAGRGRPEGIGRLQEALGHLTAAPRPRGTAAGKPRGIRRPHQAPGASGGCAKAPGDPTASPRPRGIGRPRLPRGDPTAAPRPR